MSTMTAPTVKVTGSVIAVTSNYGTNYYNRDQLTTAYLVLLDVADGEPHRGSVAVDRLKAEHGFEHRDAMACVLVASMLARHNIEP